MQLGEPGSKKSIRNVRLVLGGLALLFVIAFFREIWGVLSLFWILFKTVVLQFPLQEIDPSIRDSFNIIFFNCLNGFGAVFLFWVLLISGQALLPVSNIQELYRTAWRLWLYITRRHGPALFIKDGQLISTKEDEQRVGHGVIVIDFNSAVVLEDRDLPPGFSRLTSNLLQRILAAIGLSDPPAATRVCGPGIVFTNPRERVRGVVDLRKQFRMQTKVTCYTREGIELYANIFAMFTVGLDPDPDALDVTFVGDSRADSIRVCAFSAVQGRGGKFYKLNALNDELDEPDRKEIASTATAIHGSSEFGPYSPRRRHPTTPVYNPERVFSAVFAQARDSKQEIVPWTELPTRVAAGLYREILSTINYDELYDIRGSGQFPLPDYKSKLRLAMRNQGILAYRLVYHITGEPLVVGKTYHESELAVSLIRPLTNSKLLRDRGIKVPFSSFGDLVPVSPLVYKQRLDTWRASWEQDLDITRAGRELQAMRVRSRALADAQQDLWYNLSQLFSVEQYTDEALALRVLQALETAAADPKTRELLPAQALDMMRYINQMLNSKPAPVIPPPPSAPPILAGPTPRGND